MSREIVEDPDIQDGKLMVYTTLRGLSFAGDFYDDFLVWIWTVTNIGTKPITKAYLGMMADFDFPWATYQGYSSYNKVDCYAYDPEYSMAYGWDGDGNVAGATYGDWFHPKVPRGPRNPGRTRPRYSHPRQAGPEHDQLQAP